MRIGDQGRWWNRSIPIGKIAAATTLFLAVAFSYIYVEPAIHTCIWMLVHHSTATSNGIAVKVPWMWWQEQTPAGQRQILLRRSRWGKLYSDESIVISDNRLKPVNPNSIAQRFELIAAKLGQSGYSAEPFPSDVFVKAHYSCLTPHLVLLSNYRAVCDSKEGNFTVDLFGPNQDVDDFVTVLHNLASGRESRLSKP